MTNIVIAAGIDVGRDYLDYAVAPSGLARRVSNEPGGIKALVGHLRRSAVTRVVLEAIGPYAVRLMRALADAGFAVGVIDPRRIKAFRTAEGHRAKNDRLDAQLIARFALAMPDATRPVPSDELLQIRALSTRRRQLVEMIAMEKTRLKQAFDDTMAQSHREMIALLSHERLRVESRLEAQLRAAHAQEGLVGDRFALLQSAPGVGPAVATTLLADLPELGTIDRRAIASLAGLAPHISQSGIEQGRASIGGGRPCVRAALYMAALSASRLEHGYKHEYLAMRQAGKPAKVALIAIARKLLVTLNGMIKSNQPWKPRQSQNT